MNSNGKLAKGLKKLALTLLWLANVRDSSLISRDIRRLIY
jgi:hypothetical protein